MFPNTALLLLICGIRVMRNFSLTKPKFRYSSAVHVLHLKARFRFSAVQPLGCWLRVGPKEFLWYGMMNCLVCLVYCCHVRLAKCFNFDSRFCCFGGTPLPERGSVSIFVCQFKQWTAVKKKKTVLQNPQSLPYRSKSYMGKCKHLTQDKCLWDNKPLFSVLEANTPTA